MEGRSFYPVSYYVSSLTQKVAVRYILASRVPDPAQVWMSWFTAMDGDPIGPVVETLEPVARLVPKVLQLQQKLESYRQLIRRFRGRHEAALRTLRGKGEWTPDLIEVVQEVTKDRALMGLLGTVSDWGSDFLTDKFTDGLFDYTGKILDEKLYDKVINLLMGKAYDEAEELPGGILDPDATALRDLKGIDYRVPLEMAEKLNAAMGIREPSGILDHMKWLDDLEKNPSILEDWEDHLPHELYHDMGENLTSDSPLYEELERRQKALGVFRHDVENLFDALAATKRLGR